MVKVKEMMEKLKAENLALHNELIAEKTAFARALLSKDRLLQDMKKAANKRSRLRCNWLLSKSRSKITVW